VLSPHDYQQRAYFFFERDRFREAAAVCLEGLSENPDDVDLLYLRGLCGLRLKDQELTQTSIESLAACAPNWPCTHDLLCYRALEHGRLDAAERHSREAIRWDPEVGGRYGTLAHIFDRLGRREDAITAARRGLSLDPDNIHLLTQLQRLYHLNGEKRLADEMERRAGEVNPEDADWHLFAGLRLLEAGQKTEGRSRMRSSLMVEPNIPTERLDAMAYEIVRSHWFFKNAGFLRGDWPIRVMAVATPLIWFALGKLIWFPFSWLGWMSLILVASWFGYESLFWLCYRLIRLQIARGGL
jgi:tetratricopeptide (TPR) repeat protein